MVPSGEGRDEPRVAGHGLVAPLAIGRIEVEPGCSGWRRAGTTTTSGPLPTIDDPVEGELEFLDPDGVPEFDGLPQPIVDRGQLGERLVVDVVDGPSGQLLGDPALQPEDGR